MYLKCNLHRLRLSWRVACQRPQRCLVGIPSLTRNPVHPRVTPRSRTPVPAWPCWWKGSVCRCPGPRWWWGVEPTGLLAPRRCPGSAPAACLGSSVRPRSGRWSSLVRSLLHPPVQKVQMLAISKLQIKNTHTKICILHFLWTITASALDLSNKH